MISLTEQAKSLTLKHGLSEEAMLIEEEERKLQMLMMDHDRAYNEGDFIQSNGSYD